MPVTIYGIKNCDTMKKARAWLDSHRIAYGFHDYKTEGIAEDKLKHGAMNSAGKPCSIARAPRFANCLTPTEKA